jgi:glycosyltransferase involved in cell wall biosynthesis
LIYQGFKKIWKKKEFHSEKKYLLENDEIAIGIIGRLVPIKNHRFFIDAIHQLIQKTNKKIRVFIIGDGEEKDNLLNYCAQLDIDFIEFIKEQGKATITFTSWIKEIDWANAGLDIIALSSLNEGTPVSLIEAQASNKPIVTTNVGGVENVVLTNQTAIIVSPNDLNGFYNALLKLVEDDELRLKMGKEGWNHVREKFHYTRLVNDMQKLYVSLLNNTK